MIQTTAIAFKPIGLFDITAGASQELPALLFVVTSFGKRTNRAAVKSFAASTISKKEAIRSVVGMRV